MNYNCIRPAPQVGHGKSGSTTERVWNSGPPPHIGWWNASVGGHNNSWRWWNGTEWSYNVSATDSATDVAHFAKQISPDQDRIKWTDYWPENARVPRVDPTLRSNIGIIACINQALLFSSEDFWLSKAWEYYNKRYAPLPAAVKDDWSKWATTPPPTHSNGQVPTPQIPDYRELSAAPTRELMRELFRRLG